MRVFVYESLCGGGLDAEHAAPRAPSLLREGAAMLIALLSDLAAVESVEAVTLVDARWASALPPAVGGMAVVAADEHRAAEFDRLAATADATIVVAPEIGGELASLCRRVSRVGGRLIGPDIDAIELLSDKHRTAEHLHSHGVRACRGLRLDGGRGDERRLGEVAYPAVVKPLDGAGSLGVRLVNGPNEVGASRSPRRLESYCNGLPASIAALCGPAGIALLPACSQRIAGDGTFSYLGGTTPLPPPLSKRAELLGKAALATVAGLCGYVGVDLVLGDNPMGQNDVVVEINPRFTTSYVGLRRLCETNLAAAMLDAAFGRPMRALRFRGGTVQFDADGTTRFVLSDEA
jgi:predicted ATP-grasp superfamily ATP-dependent carboligase